MHAISAEKKLIYVFNFSSLTITTIIIITTTTTTTTIITITYSMLATIMTSTTLP